MSPKNLLVLDQQRIPHVLPALGIGQISLLHIEQFGPPGQRPKSPVLSLWGPGMTVRVSTLGPLHGFHAFVCLPPFIM